MNRSACYQRRVAPESPTRSITTINNTGSWKAKQKDVPINKKMPLSLSSKSKVQESSPQSSLPSSSQLILLSSSNKHHQNQQQQTHHHLHQPTTTTTTSSTTIPSNLSYSDVCVGDLLGSGAYASVYNVRFQTNNKQALSSPSRLQFEIVVGDQHNERHQEDEQPQPESRNQDENDERRSHDDLKHHHHHHHHHNHLKQHHGHSNVDLSNNNTQKHHHYYALKCLQQDKLLIGSKNNNDTNDDIKIATTDFIMECKILSKIAHYKHANIIGLIGISNNFVNDPSRGFLILEKVTETLQQTLIRWRCDRDGGTVVGKQQRCSSSSSSCNIMSNGGSIVAKVALHHFHYQRRNKRLLQQEQGERIRLAGLGVARALQFLHEHKIIYRDLKPANIGFSAHDGQVKLLDFGLARHISTTSSHPHPPHHDDTTSSSPQSQQRQRRKKLSGGCGTPRYAAPEVMLHQDYSFPADVHSYCILLWEIITLQRPYSNCKTVQELMDLTIQQRQRPPLTTSSSKSPQPGRGSGSSAMLGVASSDVRQLLHSGWSHHPIARPTFHSIVKQLEFHVDAISSSPSSHHHHHHSPEAGSSRKHWRPEDQTTLLPPDQHDNTTTN